VAAIAAAAGSQRARGVGARFALEPGRGRAAVPVRPALLGAVAGVLGVLAAFTFSAGVSTRLPTRRASARPGSWVRSSACPGTTSPPPPGQVVRAVAADPDVTGVDDALVGGAQSGQVSVESLPMTRWRASRVPVVLTGGRMPAAGGRDRARAHHRQRHARGRRLGGPAGRRRGPQALTVTGIGFVPEGPHNDYDEGPWLTPAGYDRLFRGAHYAFKFHLAVVSCGLARSPGGGQPAGQDGGGHQGRARRSLLAPDSAAAGPGDQDVAALPLALSAFLAVLAVGGVGHALSIAVRRRRHELAVLRALGLTRRQSRLVIGTQRPCSPPSG
jgi:hypothetical protein